MVTPKVIRGHRAFEYLAMAQPDWLPAELWWRPARAIASCWLSRPDPARARGPGQVTQGWCLTAAAC